MKPTFSKIKTALVPINGTGGENALKLAKLLAEQVVLVGFVLIENADEITASTHKARQVRKRLSNLSQGKQTRFKANVIVSDSPWEDIQNVINVEKPDIMVMDWYTETLESRFVKEMLIKAPLDLMVVRGSQPISFSKTLVPARGGPYALLALQIGLSVHREKMEVLHLSLPNRQDDRAFKGIEKILPQIPEITSRQMVTEDVAKTLLEEAADYDFVILGATANNLRGGPVISPVVERLLQESPASVAVVKTRRTSDEFVFNERAGAQAISILVDKWFAENTYQADEFANLKRLVQDKEKQGLTVSLALPALNEEKTVGKVISTIKTSLMDEVPLLDEIVLMDSDSTDRTREIAEDLGVTTYIHQHILPEMGARKGKGEALWKSLLVTKGDIIAWIDTDIANIHPRFVYGILGPLLRDANIQFVKGFYRRPLRVGKIMQAASGGRVTELTARPLLNLFFPELSGVIQPLSGEYGGRRSALEQSTFFSGYGVETGLLIDIFEQNGLNSIAQVDLLERIHHNQDLEALSKMSFAIIQTVMRKLEQRYERSIVEDVNKTMKLVHYQGGEYSLVVEEISEPERPPMITIPQYQETHLK
jgi:nucleotide-binding universal stress UspA family protein